MTPRPYRGPGLYLSGSHVANVGGHLHFQPATECQGGSCHVLPPAPPTRATTTAPGDDLDPATIYAAREQAAAEAARNRGQAPTPASEDGIFTHAGAAGVYAQRATKGAHHVQED